MTQATRAPARGAGLTAEEISAMARMLARRYRGEAASVALYFAAEHRAIGDEERAAAWTGVACCLRISDEARRQRVARPCIPARTLS